MDANELTDLRKAAAGGRGTNAGPQRLPFLLTYQLSGVGWICAVISSDRYWARLDASYLSDAVSDLLGAVAALTTGVSDSRCSWFVEPGEYRWLFNLTDDGVHLRILGFREGEQPEPDEAGTFVFETVVPLPELAKWVTRRAELMAYHQESYSYVTYENEWGHPFPHDHTEALNRYLDRHASDAST